MDIRELEKRAMVKRLETSIENLQKVLHMLEEADDRGEGVKDIVDAETKIMCAIGDMRTSLSMIEDDLKG